LLPFAAAGTLTSPCPRRDAYLQGSTERVSYRVEWRSNRKLLIVFLIATLTVPGLGAGHWVAFGPASTLQVSAIRADRSDSQLLYLASDRGVFVSHDGGGHWDQASNGLHGYAVLTLEQAINGTWVAGTNRGIFLLPAGATAWRPSNTVVNEQGTPRIIHVKGVTRRVMTHHPTRTVLQARINDIEIAPNRWLAATSSGIFSSSDQGKIWSGGTVNGEKEFIAIKAEKELVVAATRSKLFVSVDGGTVWKQVSPSSPSNSIYEVVISADSRIFVATREGAFRSADAGTSWVHLTSGLPSREIGSITFNPKHNQFFAYSNGSGLVFESSDKGQNWVRLDDAGPGVQSISAINGRLFAVTANGLLAGPEKLQDDSAQAAHSHGNWFLRLVHHSE
jgi:photosystem II stability/assembly factor-like uncharacterized protein